jgi:protein gp37
MAYFINVEAPNIYNGLTICNQAETDEKIPQLLKVPGKRWLSIEPMLSAIRPDLKDIDFVVVGCETGPKRRPCKLEWVQSLVDQCKAAGVLCYVKQIPVLRMVKGSKGTRWIDSVSHNPEEWPESLRVRKTPWQR